MQENLKNLENDEDSAIFSLQYRTFPLYSVQYSFTTCMFLAHLPAGYLTTKLAQKYFQSKSLYIWGMLGSILPDIDMFYFHFIDHRQHLHHDYLFHKPYFWVLLAIVSIGIFLFQKQKKYFWYWVIFFSNIFLHLLLDTLTGGIAWLSPLNETSYRIVTIPAVHDYRVWNFVLHWTFGLEIGIIFIALYVFVKEHKKSRA